VFDVGRELHDIRTVAAQMAALGRRELRPEITGRYRSVTCGTACRLPLAAVLGYEAAVFTEGLLELAEWLARKRVDSRVAGMWARLEARGLDA
jgi:hypothetical protein